MLIRPCQLASSALLFSFAVGSLGFAGPAAASLTPDQVLVIYDSRIQDSLAVAEYYAGSAAVPGGSGNLPGARPGVRTLDLASLGTPSPCGSPPCPPGPTIPYATFNSNYRIPIKNYLTSNNLSRKVRVLCLTKGIPHRVQDTEPAVADVGDNGGNAANEFIAGDATFCSLDAELSLLMLDLSVGEAGNTGDSKADGWILNPYWRASLPVNAWRTIHVERDKTLNTISTGQVYQGATSSLSSASILPGDIFFVCRLDGSTLANVKQTIDRAQAIILDEDSHTIILDEGAGDGLQNISDTDSEYDNDGNTTYYNGGDDYEQTRDALLTDGKWLPANIHYDFAPGPAGFIVGPLINFGGGIVVSSPSSPVIHLASMGQNHQGGEPGNAGMQYAESLYYAPGAVFNTIESFNGRAFGGLGTIVAQEQLADFLSSGGTLGIGNVWEPLSLTVADNYQIAKNFWLGNLTWIEAAYSSLPVLSWQQIVVGDPLARVTSKREDIDGNGVINMDDLYAWYESPSPRDINRDGMSDIRDARLIEAAVRRADTVDMNASPFGKQLD